MTVNQKAKFRLPIELAAPAAVLACIASYVDAFRHILPDRGQLALAFGSFAFVIACVAYVWRARAELSVFDIGGEPKPKFRLRTKLFSLFCAAVAAIPLAMNIFFASGEAVAKTESPVPAVEVNSPKITGGNATYNNSPGIANNFSLFNIPPDNDGRATSDQDAAEDKTIKTLEMSGQSEEARSLMIDRINSLKLSIDSGEQPLARKIARYCLLCCQVASMYETKGQLHDAEIWTKKALSMSPEYVTGLIELAGIYTEQSKNDDAERLYRKVVSSTDAADDQKEVATADLGVILLEKGKIDDAEPIFQKTLASALKTNDFSSMVSSWIYLGKIALLRKEFKKAEGFFHDALDIAHKSECSPGSMAACYINLAMVYRGEKDDEAAKKALNQAIDIAQHEKLGRQEADAHLLLGNIYLAQGAIPLGGMEHQLALKWHKDNGVPWNGPNIIQITPDGADEVKTGSVP
jgi:Tfp pilus assembly protein PilF